MQITTVLEAIQYDVKELKTHLNEDEIHPHLPGCCRLAYKQAIKDVLEIIDGYNSKEYQKEATTIFAQSESPSISDQ